MATKKNTETRTATVTETATQTVMSTQTETIIYRLTPTGWVEDRRPLGRPDPTRLLTGWGNYPH